MPEMIDLLGASEALSLETAFAVVIALMVSMIIFLTLRRVPVFSRIVLPGLGLTRSARKKATDLLKSKNLNQGHYQFIGLIVLAYALRGAASILTIAWIYSTTMQAIAPLL